MKNNNTRNTRKNLNQFYAYNPDLSYKQNKLDNFTYSVINVFITVSIVVFGGICLYAICTID